MATRKVKINRAPVLTLWATVVAERLGYDRDEALTLGKALAGLNAQSKGRRLGIYKPGEEKPPKEQAEKAEKRKAEQELVDLMGRAVPVVKTPAGYRATVKGQPTTPESVDRYLKAKFGDALPDVREAMEKLAGSLKPQQLAARAFPLYEEFRPKIPAGTKGWGAKGELDLDEIRALAKAR